MVTRLSKARFAVVCAAAAVLAACGSSGSTSSSSSGSAAPVQSGDLSPSALGPENPASGAPFVVGMAVESGGVAIDTSGQADGAQAAAEYVNDHLGGIGGRRLQIDRCDTRTTVEGATDCANRFVQEGVAAFLQVASANGEILAGAANRAGIPYVVLNGASGAELTGATSFTLTGAVASLLGAPAVHMQQHQLSSIAMLTVDVPSATAALQAFGQPVYKLAGLDARLIAVPPGTADMSAQVAAAGDVDAYLVLGDPGFCTSGFQAVRAFAPSKVIFATPYCIDKQSSAAIPGGYAGILTASATELDPATADYQLFAAVMQRYRAGSGATSQLADGFVTTLAFARLMKGYAGDGNAESVLTQLRTGAAELPLGGGTTLTCGRSPVALLPSLCSLGAFIATLNSDGDPVSFTRADPTPLFAR